MSRYPIHQVQEGVWYPDTTVHTGDSTDWFAYVGGVELCISTLDNGRYAASAWNGCEQICDRAGDDTLATFDEAEAALLAAIEAADKPQWIDLPSGLAAMCEWRGWTLTVGQCTAGNGWWFHVCNGSGGGADADRFVNLIDAELAAEAWVREQTGKGEMT